MTHLSHVLISTIPFNLRATIHVREFNLSILGKWCWRMLVDKDGLWYRGLKARYREKGGQLKEGGRLGSTWWKSMAGIHYRISMGVRSWFDDNILRNVGDGSSTFFLDGQMDWRCSFEC